MERSGRPAVVLLSGGLDSATTLATVLREGYRAHALTLSYGQRHGIEIDCAARIAEALGAESHRTLRLDLSLLRGSALTDPSVPVPKRRTVDQMSEGIPPTYVPARNTVFLALALAWAESLGAQDIFIGVNAVDYSGYPDCRPAFLQAFEQLARLATREGVSGRPFRIHAPLVELSKAEIIGRATELGVDLGLTVSCYEPDGAGRACNECDSCLLRARGFREAGLDDPALGPSRG